MTIRDDDASPHFCAVLQNCNIWRADRTVIFSPHVIAGQILGQHGGVKVSCPLLGGPSAMTVWIE